jgi:hypothetical protein
LANPGDGLARDERLAAGEAGGLEDGDAVTEGRGDFAGFVGLDELGVQVGRRVGGEHRALAAGDDDGVDVEVVDTARVVVQFHELGVVEVATADDVVGLPAAGVVGVGHGVGLASAAVGAEDLDLVAGFGELEVGVGQLGPPEPHRPPGSGRHGGVGDDDGDALWLGGVDDVDCLVTHRGAVLSCLSVHHK